MKVSIVFLVAIVYSAAALSYPRHDPNVFDGGNLWTITYYHDTSTVHSQWATQRICFLPYAAPGVGQTNIYGRWYSTSYPNWHGHYQQEGDTVKMVGNFWDGRGNDSMLWDIVTSSRANIGAGHWLEWGDNGMSGPVYGMGNTLFQRVGKCRNLIDAQDASPEAKLVLPEIKARYLTSGKEAEFPMQEGQEQLKGTNELEELF